MLVDVLTEACETQKSSEGDLVFNAGFMTPLAQEGITLAFRNF
jgi:hypothetical protein